MKQVFHKIISLSMAFVVLFSTTSFTMDMHYCGGTLMDTAIFHKVQTCGMDMEKALTEDCSNTNNKKDCCNDEQVVLDGQDELQLSFNKISFEQHLFITSFVYSYIHLFESVDKKGSSFEEYEPPLVVKEIFKIDETYLI